MLTFHQRIMIRHGLIVSILGLIGGFMLVFSMLGVISFSPLPFNINYEIPGTPSRWRAVHIGNLMNGLMAITLALPLSKLILTDRAKSFVCYGTVATIWGNASFYIFGVFAPNHGLTLGDNRLGEANWAGILAFLPAIIVAIVLICVLIVMLRGIPKDDSVK